MVCVPCIFIGFAIVVWCKFLEPYLKPVYERLCQYYPPIRNVGNLLGNGLLKLEKFGEKIGIRMPESCPMPKKKTNNKTDASKEPSNTDTNKLYPDLRMDESNDSQMQQRSVTSSTLNCD